MMMRFSTLVVIFGCMVATMNLYAQSAVEDRKTTSTQRTQSDKQRTPATKSPRQPAKPAATFKPSERIGADSTVSFPVDI